ncbi:hypothetical protein ACH5RR_006141 [Cinchona calisaya]|uniref:Protein kinase domain-containing protein n=1 Tax=Cinchona calisaya TaxID=153742 RepID=A0ABD3AN53_9GENT
MKIPVRESYTGTSSPATSKVSDFGPKVSDFGLARTAMDEKDKHVSTRIMGTFGYVTPDYALTSHLVKSNVSSYGVEMSNRPFMGEVVQALKLICNECGETKETRFRSCSREDLSLDMDAGIINSLDHLGVPLQDQSPVSNHDCELDVERGLSVSDLLCSSVKFAMQDLSLLGGTRIQSN